MSKAHSMSLSLQMGAPFFSSSKPSPQRAPVNAVLFSLGRSSIVGANKRQQMVDKPAIFGMRVVLRMMIVDPCSFSETSAATNRRLVGFIGSSSSVTQLIESRSTRHRLRMAMFVSAQYVISRGEYGPRSSMLPEYSDCELLLLPSFRSNSSSALSEKID